MQEAIPRQLDLLSVLWDGHNAGAAGGPTAEGLACPSDSPSDATAAALWTHSRTGAVVPRGTVLSYPLSPDERGALAASEVRRGLDPAARLSLRHVKRTRADEVQLDELCGWLASAGLDVFGSVTFSDEYAAKHGVYSLHAGLRDVSRGLRDMTVCHGRRKGFLGRFVLAGEWHPSGRQVPHVHLALESRGFDTEQLCRELWTYFFNTRGRSRFEPMRDVARASLYALKDTVKASKSDANAILVRLDRPRAARRLRVGRSDRGTRLLSPAPG